MSKGSTGMEVILASLKVSSYLKIIIYHASSHFNLFCFKKKISMHVTCCLLLFNMLDSVSGLNVARSLLENLKAENLRKNCFCKNQPWESVRADVALGDALRSQDQPQVK